MQLDLCKINHLVINLPERTERIIQFTHEYHHLFNDDCIPNIINGVRDMPSFHGIAKAHMNCIHVAKGNSWENVLIMEDDLYIPAKEKARPYMESCFNKLPEDWDILLGGVYHSQFMEKENNYWNRLVGEFCALHFYVVNHRAYDKLLTWDQTNHYDRWIAKTGLKCYVPNKFFAIQHDGYSDNVNKLTDYNSTYLNKFTILK